MRPVFIDTGAWYALINRLDAHHAGAARFFSESSSHWLTTNYVVLETVNLLNARAGHDPARVFLETLRASKALTLHHIAAKEHHEAEVYFLRRQDKTYSLTDCASFVVMESLALQEAFAFDRHFSQAGVATVPRTPQP